MKYLVTGGAGFIGSHLVDGLLLGTNDEVVILDNLSTGQAENFGGWPASLKFRFINGDATDPWCLDDCVDGADAVFHLASMVGVERVLSRPAETLWSIVEGGIAVVDACVRHKKPLLITSSSEVYGQSDRLPYREDGPCVLGPGPRWTYATAKLAVEQYALAKMTKWPIVIIRLFNTVGPRQSDQYGMVLPRFVRQALAGEPITVYDDGRQTRSFCHVADVVEALKPLLWTPGAFGQIVNVGSDEETTIRILAQAVKLAAGSSSEIKHVPSGNALVPRHEDVRRRVPDLTMLRRLYPLWSPRPLEVIIRDAIKHERGKA